MWYQKNLPLWERLLRLVAAGAMIAWGLIGLSGLTVGYAIAAAGAFTALTAFFGFCPACAMVGRRLKQPG